MSTEATGYGVVYFAEQMLARRNESLVGKSCLVSGCGKVALSTMEKLLECGASVITFSDTSGAIHDPEGIDQEKLEWLKELKNVRRGCVREYAEEFPSAEFNAAESADLDENPVWHHEADCAFPCARQHEISSKDAQALLHNGIQLIVEGANLPTTAEAAKLFRDKKVLYAPGKAANAGGAAVSGLEMAQNAMHYAWTRDEVDERLQIIMKDIHESCVNAAAEYGTPEDYINGANIAGFIRVADAMISQGI
jgi:glutamate dehydrogenase (NADP+)